MGVAAGGGGGGGAAGGVCAQCKLQGEKCAQKLNGQTSCSQPDASGES
jgi:hypothetical protein